MSEIISREELDSLSKVKGEVRGLGLKVISDFALKERGEEGPKLLEETMAKLGYPVKYKEVKRTDFYPLKREAINFLVASRLFNFDDEKIREIGQTLARAPMVPRLFLRYIASFDRIFKNISVMWKKAYTVGNLSLVDSSVKEKFAILRLENFNIHPLYCQLFISHFATLLQMVIRKKVSCKEIKCTFRGDAYHEFVLKW